MLSNDGPETFEYRYSNCPFGSRKLKYVIQFNTIKSKDSFLSIRTNKYKPSDYHYTNLGSKSSSFKKSTSIDTAVSQFCDIQKFPGQKQELSVSTKAAIRRCLSVPSIKIDTCSNRCGNCSGQSFDKILVWYQCGSNLMPYFSCAKLTEFQY